MKINLHKLVFETTRRCNQRCDGYCMRGPIQNINITTDIVDAVLDNNDFGYITSINFSGGEPTLNPEIIVYTINKIIEQNLDVREVVMVTNGLKFSLQIVEAFNRFNEYRNIKVHKRIREDCTNLDEETLNEQIKGNTDNHARITFSTDQFHRPLKPEIKDAYQNASKGIKISETGNKKDDDINRSGFSDIGKDIDYSKLIHIMQNGRNSIYLIETIYVTAIGNYVIGGDGAYTTMDQINCGNVNEVTVHNVVAHYGVSKDAKINEVLETWKNQNAPNESKRTL